MKMGHAAIRQANSKDAQALAMLKKTIWQEEESDPRKITAALSHPDHKTFVAEAGDQIIGFVDGFSTLSARCVLRWEVDLLGVAPAWRGHRLGEHLTRACLQAGQKRGARLARALIQVNNFASQITFQRLEFISQAMIYRLYVTRTPVAELPSSSHAHLISVVTFNYCGVWLEEDFSPSALITGRAALNNPMNELAGVLIPEDKPESIQFAETQGFSLVGFYQWWQIALKSS
jgi:ribosomal protein S18 acetylase RimI-like enzyme